MMVVEVRGVRYEYPEQAREIRLAMAEAGIVDLHVGGGAVLNPTDDDLAAAK